MNTLIPSFLRRQRNQRRLTLEMLSAKVGMSPQHLSEIESGKRDPRLSSIERMAEAMGMTVLIVPDAMAPDLRRYVARAWLGHVSLDTTNVYAEVDLEMKAKALAAVELPSMVLPDGQNQLPSLMAFMKGL